MSENSLRSVLELLAKAQFDRCDGPDSDCETSECRCVCRIARACLAKLAATQEPQPPQTDGIEGTFPAGPEVIKTVVDEANKSSSLDLEFMNDVQLRLVASELRQDIEDLRGVITGLREVAQGKFKPLEQIERELEREAPPDLQK